MTPKERAAMQQALEALLDVGDYDKCLEAITALRETLAEQAEQEPVAWMDLHKELGTFQWLGVDEGWDMAIAAVRKRLEELSTAPVRTKDLTDDEIAALWASDGFYRTPTDFARAVIAADRSKNGII